eukprot:TRINITY_DN19914_c0_g7_i1.p1 TRINITY_DN19914_c0_g7~~TRINITY_DN19914_c0_g7_i1.p1  ORF type:complete len:1695 (+),score=350.87 TRINITY_DN19914_c0_g7_i1:196-5280(+)
MGNAHRAHSALHQNVSADAACSAAEPGRSSACPCTPCCGSPLEVKPWRLPLWRGTPSRAPPKSPPKSPPDGGSTGAGDEEFGRVPSITQRKPHRVSTDSSEASLSPGCRRVHRSFKVSLAYADRHALRACVGAAAPTRVIPAEHTDAEVLACLAVTDARGYMLDPNHLPSDSGAYPLDVRYCKPAVRISNPRLRGIRLDDLLRFFESSCGHTAYVDDAKAKPLLVATKLIRKCNTYNMLHCDSKQKKEPNMYAVDSLITRPLTEEHRLSVAELWAPRGGVPIECFVSHYWGEPFDEFCQSIYRFALQRTSRLHPGGGREERDRLARRLSMYVCAFSNNQWNLNSELGETIEDSPFYKILRAESTQLVLLNLDMNCSSLFRAWCCFEFYFSHSLLKTVVLNTRYGSMQDLCTDKYTAKLAELYILHVFEILQDVDVGKAVATRKEDSQMIQKAIQCFTGTGVADGLVGAAALNRMLKAAVSNQALPGLAKAGNVHEIQVALENRADPNMKDPYNVYALTYAAAMHGSDSQVVTTLLAGNANPKGAESAKDVISMFLGSSSDRKAAMMRVRLLVSRSPTSVHGAALKTARAAHVAQARAALEELALETAVEPLVNNLTKELDHIEEDDTDEHRSTKSAKSVSHTATSATAPIYAKHLEDDDADIRRAAVEALGDLRDCAAAHLGVIAERLGDEDGEVRKAALDAMGQVAGENLPEHIGAIAERLADPDNSVREAACTLIKSLGDAAAPHAEAIADNLSADCCAVREAACEALGTLGEAAAAQVPKICELLGDGETNVRKAALDALAQVGPVANNAGADAFAAGCGDCAGAGAGVSAVAAIADQVAEHLADQDWSVRAAACHALASMGTHTDKIAVMLRDADSDVRQTALTSLQCAQKAVLVEHVPTIVELLQDGDCAVREAACSVLAEVPEAAASHAAAIANGLSDTSNEVREAACKVLGELGDASKECIPQVLECMNDLDDNVRITALETAARLTDASSEHAPIVTAHIVNHLGDEDVRVRGAACAALGQMKNLGVVEKAAIVETLQDTESDVRKIALETIVQVGSDAVSENACVIARQLADTDASVRELASSALADLGHSEHVAAVVEVLDDEDSDVRVAACEALAQLADNAVSHTTKIVERLNDDDGDVRRAALATIATIGKTTTEHDPLIVDHIASKLRDTDERVRSQACAALGAIGEAGAAQASAIVDSLQDENCLVRKNAVHALVQLGTDVLTQNSGAIVRQLADEDLVVREAASSALAELDINDHAQAVLDALEDDHADVRRSACEALAQLEGAGAAHAERLADRLEDDSSAVRCAALASIVLLGEKATENVPDVAERIVECLGDDSGSVRGAACAALAQLAQCTDECHTAALAEALHDRESDVRTRALEALGEAGDLAVAKYAVPIARQLGDGNEVVREAAIEALAELDSASRADAIAALLGDQSAPVRESACEYLAGLGDAGLTHAQRVVDLFHDGDASVRKAAVGAIAELGEGVTREVPDVAESLISQLGDDDATIRSAACVALGRLGGARGTAAAAAPEAAIAKALQDSAAPVRRVAVQALQRLGGVTAVAANCEAIARRQLSDVDSSVRTAAFAALAELGPAAHAEAVATALDDSNSEVREAGAQPESVREVRSPTPGDCQLRSPPLKPVTSILPLVHANLETRLACRGEAEAKEERESALCDV